MDYNKSILCQARKNKIVHKSHVRKCYYDPFSRPQFSELYNVPSPGLVSARDFCHRFENTPSKNFGDF